MQRAPITKQRPPGRPRAPGKGFELDRYTSADVRSWNKKSRALDAYHVRLFYHLEALRSTKQDEIRESLRDAPTASLDTTGWGRIVDLRYALNPLSAAGSLKRGGRFNIGKDLDQTKFPSFPALYIAEDYDTAYQEKFGVSSSELQVHELGLRAPSSFLYAQLDGSIENLFDLREAESLESFLEIIKTFRLPRELRQLANEIGIPPPWTISNLGQLQHSLIDPNWKHYPIQHGIPANPQVFGRLLEDAGFQGVVYPSVKGEAACAALFIRNFESSPSHVFIKDEYPEEISISRLDSDSWQELQK